MTIKKELEGKAKDFTEDYKEEKKPMKKETKSENEINQLKKCMKEKDKRIKKIEGYFKLINKLILSVLWSLLCALPWLLLILYVERPPTIFVTPLATLIFSSIGVIVSIAGAFIILMFGMEKIWSNW